MCGEQGDYFASWLAVEQLSNGQYNMVIAICTLHALPRERGGRTKKSGKTVMLDWAGGSEMGGGGWGARGRESLFTLCADR